MLRGDKPLQHPRKSKKEEIERPDAQHAPHVKGTEVDVAEAMPLADEKLGNEVGAEQEEQVDAEGPRCADCGEGRGDRGRDAHAAVELRMMGQRVVEKCKKECKEAQDIELGMIETPGERAGDIHGHRALRKR